MKKIELKNLTKIFETRAEGGEPVRVVHALDDVSLTFNAGELHALLGENGAGKSTLVKILAGLHEATSGTVSLAQGTSVALVHQHAILCDDLSIFENIILYEPNFWLRKKKLTERVQELMKESSIQLNLGKKVRDTNGLEKFYIEYLVARMRNPDFLILDEPASILGSKDYEAYFTMLKGFCKNGLGIILITHRISEALQWADTISILQKGQLIFSKSVHDQKITAQELTMVLLNHSENAEVGGGALGDSELETGESRNELSSRDAGELPAFRVKGLSAHLYGKPALSNISFSLNTASITAVYGTDAKILSSLEDALFGMCPLNSGIIFIGNNGLHHKNINPTNLRKHKLGYVPSNRSFRASSPDLSLFELICAHRFPTILTHKKELLSFAQHILETEHINAPLHRKVATLSGGQLQRLILARELSENPNVLILAEPEWGLDIRSSAALRKRLQKIAATGTAILILTENPDSFRDDSFFNAIYELQESGLVQSSDIKGGKHTE